MYYMGFTYIESYNLPIWKRLWFLDRINKEIKRANEANKGQGAPSRAAHDNTPDARSWMQRSRDMVPAKLRRFT
jgi:hypothetical protein